MTQWYDRTGQAITDEQANEYLCDPSYYMLARQVEGAHVVATTWLGTDHPCAEPGPRRLFQVRIHGPSRPTWLKLYPTEETALAGHEEAVKALRTVSVVWGVGNGGSYEHAFPAVAAEPDEDLWSLCVFARSLTDPPTERGDLDRCPTCERTYRIRLDGENGQRAQTVDVHRFVRWEEC